jgi:hypothetical protein
LINLHPLPDRPLARLTDILHRHILADILLRDDLLIQHRRRAPCKLVVPHLLLPHIGRDVIPQQLRLLGRNHANIHITPTTQIVPDTRLDRIRAELHRLVPSQVCLPLRLEDAHGRQAAGAHGDVGQLVGGAVGVDGEEVGAGGVAAGDDEVGADVALVAEEVLLEHGHDGDDAGLAAGGQGVQLEVGGDEGGGELGVGGSTGAGAPDLGGDVVELFAVLWEIDGLAGVLDGDGEWWVVCKTGGSPCLLLWDRKWLWYLRQ